VFKIEIKECSKIKNEPISEESVFIVEIAPIDLKERPVRVQDFHNDVRETAIEISIPNVKTNNCFDHHFVKLRMFQK